MPFIFGRGHMTLMSDSMHQSPLRSGPSGLSLFCTSIRQLLRHPKLTIPNRKMLVSMWKHPNRVHKTSTQREQRPWRWRTFHRYTLSSWLTIVSAGLCTVLYIVYCWILHWKCAKLLYSTRQRVLSLSVQGSQMARRSNRVYGNCIHFVNNLQPSTYCMAHVRPSNMNTHNSVSLNLLLGPSVIPVSVALLEAHLYSSVSVLGETQAGICHIMVDNGDG